MPREFATPELYIEHVPDTSADLDRNGLREVNELPGHVYFGLVIEGVKVPLGSKATAGLLADIERAQADAEAAKSSRSKPSSSDE